MSKISRLELARVIARRPQPQAIAAYLFQANRLHELAPLLRDVASEWAEAGSLEVVAWSAHALSPAVLRDIRVEAKRLYPALRHITIMQQLDPSLIGGVRVRLGEYELDYTVRGRFERFAAKALKASA